MRKWRQQSLRLGSLSALAAATIGVLLFPLPSKGQQSESALAALYSQQVDRRLNLPIGEQRRYAELLARALSDAGLRDLPSQYFVLADRSEFVQSVMIIWKSPDGNMILIGASPTSTGRTGQLEYFKTPTGVFAHTLDNPDFRAEGTRNENGILGYGLKGMRVYDFGWITAPKGWGDRKESVMRLQMHSTDPEILEPRLGSIQSKGCVRVPAKFNVFIDHYGILDANYDRSIQAGKKFWVLLPTRQPTPYSGQYLVVVDSELKERPSWSPSPVPVKAPAKAK